MGGPLDGTSIEIGGDEELPGDLVMPAVVGAELKLIQDGTYRGGDLLSYRLATGTVGRTPRYVLAGPA